MKNELIEEVKKIIDENPDIKEMVVKATTPTNKIEVICAAVMEITDDEIKAIEEMIKKQKEFNSADIQFTIHQHKLGRYNESVLNKIRDIRNTIEEGEELSLERKYSV